MTKTNEEKAKNLIQFLGGIVTKSASKHETEVSKEGIDKLIEIAIKFLELKNKNEDHYEVKNKSTWIRTQEKNQFVKYVTNELKKIFGEALKNQDSETTRYVILQISLILNKVMRGKNNFSILSNLIETRNVTGTTYLQLLNQSLEVGGSLEKHLLTRHLVSIPQFSIIENQYKLEYVYEFINYHIYRLTRLIIDHEDFEAFKEEINHFFNSLHFKDPTDIARRITGNLYMIHLVAFNSKLNKELDGIAFHIETICLKDFKEISKAVQKLDDFEKHLYQELENQDVNNDNVKDRIQKIREQLIEFYVSNLIHGTFFKLGAYLLSKGPKFYRYIEELWYHGTGLDTHTIQVNSTPVSESVGWLTLYTTYSGEGTQFLDEFYTFEDFPDAIAFHYQYYALMMIKLGSVYDFNIPKIEKFKQQENREKFDFNYELASILKIDEFTKSFELVSKNKVLLEIIRTAEIQKNIKLVKKGFEKLKQDKKKVEQLLVSQGTLSMQRISEVKDQMKKKYLKDSMTDKIAKIKYSPSIRDMNFKIKTSKSAVRRDHFIEQSFKGMFLMDPTFSDIAHQELLEVFKIIRINTSPVYQDTLDFVEQIKSAINHLKDKGKKPDTIFLPLNLEMDLTMKGFTTLSPKRLIKIDETELIPINSWKQFDFNDIIVYDSSGIEITYGAQNLDERFSTEFEDIEDKLAVIFTHKLLMYVKVLESNSFRRIINRNVIQLKTK